MVCESVELATGRKKNGARDAGVDMHSAKWALEGMVARHNEGRQAGMLEETEERITCSHLEESVDFVIVKLSKRGWLGGGWICRDSGKHWQMKGCKRGCLMAAWQCKWGKEGIKRGYRIGGIRR